MVTVTVGACVQEQGDELGVAVDDRAYEK